MATLGRPCPLCGGTLHKYLGAIEEPRITSYGQHVRVARPATFWACGACEHCEEHVATPRPPAAS